MASQSNRANQGSSPSLIDVFTGRQAGAEGANANAMANAAAVCGGAYCSYYCKGLISMALFIIGCIAAAGGFETVGYVTIGLATAQLLCQFIVTILTGLNKKNAFDLVTTLVILTLGILGATSVFVGTQVGYGIIGTMCASLIIGSCVAYCMYKRSMRIMGNQANQMGQAVGQAMDRARRDPALYQASLPIMDQINSSLSVRDRTQRQSVFESQAQDASTASHDLP